MLNKSYYYDGLENNNFLKEINNENNIIENILSYKSLLLFYINYE